MDACNTYNPTNNVKRQPAERPKQSPGRQVKKDKKDEKHCELLFVNCISLKRILPKDQRKTPCKPG